MVVAPHETVDDSKDKAKTKAVQVHAMFSAIAFRYDLLNSLLSLGIDRRWRQEAVRVAFERRPKHVLDVATGTADLALAMKRAHPEAEIVGLDFAEPMLALGRRKAAQRGLQLRLEQGDGLNLPYAEHSFDAITIAYGLRNFADYQRGLNEFFRVLKPGGRLVVLEFPPPPDGLFGQLFRFYFLHVLPRVGGILSGSDNAYSYLPASVLEFPKSVVLVGMMQEAGFTGVRYRLQTLGVSAIHMGEKDA